MGKVTKKKDQLALNFQCVNHWFLEHIFTLLIFKPTTFIPRMILLNCTSRRTIRVDNNVVSFQIDSHCKNAFQMYYCSYPSNQSYLNRQTNEICQDFIYFTHKWWPAFQNCNRARKQFLHNKSKEIQLNLT